MARPMKPGSLTMTWGSFMKHVAVNDSVRRRVSFLCFPFSRWFIFAHACFALQSSAIWLFTTLRVCAELTGRLRTVFRIFLLLCNTLRIAQLEHWTVIVHNFFAIRRTYQRFISIAVIGRCTSIMCSYFGRWGGGGELWGMWGVAFLWSCRDHEVQIGGT